MNRAIIIDADDTTKIQTVRIQTDAVHVREHVERMQNYGFSSVPPPAAGDDAVEAIIGQQTIASGLPAVLADVDRRYRPTGQAVGSAIQYDNAGGMHLVAGGAHTFTGDIEAKGDVKIDGALNVIDGYSTGGIAGISGTLTITLPGMAGVATITWTDGLVTAVMGTGTCVWAPVLGG